MSSGVLIKFCISIWLCQIDSWKVSNLRTMMSLFLEWKGRLECFNDVLPVCNVVPKWSMMDDVKMVLEFCQKAVEIKVQPFFFSK